LCLPSEAQMADLEISQPQAISSLPGTTVTFTHQISHAGVDILPDIILFSAQSQAWPTTVHPTSVQLLPTENTTVTVSVTIPETASWGDTDIITLKATSQNDPSVTSVTYDSVSVDTAQVVIDNNITAAGVQSSTITLAPHSSVRWINQTTAAQILGDCTIKDPPIYRLYLPLIFFQISGEVVVPSRADVGQETAIQAGSPIEATIEAGQIYSRTFTESGTYEYCLESQANQATYTVHVLEPPEADFFVALEPVHQLGPQGDEAQFQIHTVPLNGFNDDVTLSVVNLAAPLQATLTPNPFSPPDQADLLITVPDTTPVDSYSVTVLAQAGTISKTVSGSLQVLPTGVDLVGDFFTIAPLDPEPSEPVTISVGVTNQGADDVQTPFTVTLSVTQTTVSETTTLDSVHWIVNALSAQQMVTLTDIYTLPEQAIYTITAAIDATQVVSETDEANNDLGPIIINTIPDLPAVPVIFAVDADFVPFANNTAFRGQTIYLVLHNHDPGTYNLYFNDGNSDIFVGTVSVDQSGVHSPISFTVPNNTVLGGRALLSQDALTGNDVAAGTVIVDASGGNFVVALSPISRTVVMDNFAPEADETITYTLSISPVNGFANPVSLTFLQVPTGTAVAYDEATLNATGSTILTITNAYTDLIRTPPPGVHALSILAHTDTLSHTTTSVLNIIRDNLDVAIVLDKSGSMEFNTHCYGCWVRGDRIAPPNPDPGIYPAANGHFPEVDPTNPDTFIYPGNGRIFPISYANAQSLEMCNPNPVSNPHTYVFGGFNYMILEAELFSMNNPIMETAFLEAGKAYWNIQRGESIYGQEFQTPNAYADVTKPYIASTGHSIDNMGAHIQVMPDVRPLGVHYEESRILQGDAPRLEYDFKFRGTGWTGDAYIWVRMHGSRGIRITDQLWNDNSETDLYWDIVWEADDGTLAMDAPGYIPPNLRNIQDSVVNFGFAKSYDPADADGGWRWRTIGSFNSLDPNNIYRLYFYASTFGFAIDRIVITNNPNGPTSDNSHSDVPATIRNGTQPPTGGSAFRAACDPCNPIFGHNIVASGQGDLDPNDGTPDPVYSVDHCTLYRYTQPVNQGHWETNPLFGDFENPLRLEKEGIKHLLTSESGLDPARDQVGFVAYNNAADYQDTRTELDCVRRLGRDSCVDNGFANVVAALENVRAGGSTNIGAGMKDGLEILGLDLYDPDNQSNLNFDCGGELCSRGGFASKVLIVFTDGVPNETADGDCDDPNDPDAQTWLPNNNGAHRCPLWFAKKAADYGVSVYVVGLGNGVEKDYLRELARIGNGQFYFSETGADIHQIMTEVDRSNRISSYCPVLPIGLQADSLALLAEGDDFTDINPGVQSGQYTWLRWRDGQSALDDQDTDSSAYLQNAVIKPWLAKLDYLNPNNANDALLNAGDTVFGLSYMSVSVDPGGCLRHRYSFRSLRIS
ncbi:MAG: VWA domain-containing protein, partial [Chloroflexota bacterium]